MNKFNMFLTVGLMVSVATTALPVGEQQRELLYSLRELGQDFTQEPMIQQNVDMFITIFQLNTKLLESKLQVADKGFKNTLVKSMGITGITCLSRALVNALALSTYGYFNKDNAYAKTVASILAKIIDTFGMGMASISTFYASATLYDAFKERNALRQALVVDQEILEILVSMKSFGQNGLNILPDNNDQQATDTEVLESAFEQE